MVAHSDYLRPMSTLPDQDADTSWWLVRKKLWPMTEFLLGEERRPSARVGETSAPNADEAPPGARAGRDTVETGALQEVPAFMEVKVHEDTNSFAKHTSHSYLDASLAEIKASLRSFGGRARSP
mmetsp:Transcript_3171/g.9294  ORF Transcript_3171/g.9294 Transcript_3171/m.9294 type:complete len:124 (-) Transcript_3171:319-690(-)